MKCFKSSILLLILALNMFIVDSSLLSRRSKSKINFNRSTSLTEDGEGDVYYLDRQTVHVKVLKPYMDLV